jgi:hypothetical protein
MFKYGANLAPGAFHPEGLSDGDRVTPILRCTTYINVAITLDHQHDWGLGRAYQRRRRPCGGNYMSQSISMRDGPRLPGDCEF